MHKLWDSGRNGTARLSCMTTMVDVATKRGGRARPRPSTVRAAVRTTRFTIVGEVGEFRAVGAANLPLHVYWTHNDRGWAVGPDGAPLGLWASEEFCAQRILPGGHVGAVRTFVIGDLVGIWRH